MYRSESLIEILLTCVNKVVKIIPYHKWTSCVIVKVSFNKHSFFLHKSLSGFHLSCLLLCSWHILPSSHELAYARESVNGGICKLKWLIWKNHGDVSLLWGWEKERERKNEKERALGEDRGLSTPRWFTRCWRRIRRRSMNEQRCVCQRCSFSSVTCNTTELWEQSQITVESRRFYDTITTINNNDFSNIFPEYPACLLLADYTGHIKSFCSLKKFLVCLSKLGNKGMILFYCKLNVLFKSVLQHSGRKKV